MAELVADMDMEIQFDERVVYWCWLSGPKLFRPEACPACASSKLCEFIFPFPFPFLMHLIAEPSGDQQKPIMQPFTFSTRLQFNFPRQINGTREGAARLYKWLA